MKLKLEITCDNLAFEDNPNEEIKRILLTLVEKLETGDFDIVPLCDDNGNRVGFAEFSK